jgi:KUP system potassium uptake protein
MTTEQSEVIKPAKSHHAGLLLLILGALGVVFGDIGTSPLYAINEIFFGHAMSHIVRMDVLGAISLVFWALTLVISFKYVFFVMQADNDGEGGVFALYGQIRSFPKAPLILLSFLLFGSGLLYGDGMITPAISVISAVEGLKVIAPNLESFVVPITIAILILLFSIQKNGTHKVGTFFGPIMVIWFFTLGILGFNNIIKTPDILTALSPYYAYYFVTHNAFHTILLTLGSVMLAVTGGEAMFADMGHFGKLPIRVAWYVLAYPALLLNYFGQGAYLLSGSPVLHGTIFYSMAPSFILPFLIILATCATIIASQAMISGAFSLTKQAIALRLLPYIPITYTHKDHEGQIYLPLINWALFIGSVTLVLIFQSSNRLAGAYGLAVADDMFITTVSIMIIAQRKWKWDPRFVYLLFIPFLFVDASFLGANSLKIFEGGWIPLTIGLFIFSVIETWRWGRKHTLNTFNRQKIMTIREIIKLQRTTPNDLPRTMVFLTRTAVTGLDDRVPIQLQRYWDRNNGLPEHLVLLNVELLKVPHAHERLVVRQLTKRDEPTGTVTSISANFGFMENPELEPLVRQCIRHEDIPSDQPEKQWTFSVLHERIQLEKGASLWTKIRYNIYDFLHRNTLKADEYFGLGDDHMLTIDVCPVELS